LIDFVGEVISNVVIDMLKIIPSSRHVPRITIDRLVIARETWSFLPEELSLPMRKMSSNAISAPGDGCAITTFRELYL
jgi:hypothetical protein